jgi:hypothetical protein
MPQNDPLDRSDEDVTKELCQPLEELLAKADEKLKKVDELIHEAEGKGKPVLNPEP